MYRRRRSLIYRLAVSIGLVRTEWIAYRNYPTLNIRVSEDPRFISVLASKVDPSRFLLGDMDFPLYRVVVLSIDISEDLTNVSESIESGENALSCL